MRWTLLFLFLAGCGSGYSVEEKTVPEICPNGQPPAVTRQYVCKRLRPIFFSDNTLAICTTREECNAFCLGLTTAELKADR